jgi:hypothetical protein
MTQPDELALAMGRGGNAEVAAAKDSLLRALLREREELLAALDRKAHTPPSKAALSTPLSRHSSAESMADTVLDGTPPRRQALSPPLGGEPPLSPGRRLRSRASEPEHRVLRSASSSGFHVTRWALEDMQAASPSAARALHYARQGSASYRSASPRFGSASELGMAGATPLSNPALSSKERRPCIGLYKNIYRDAKGTHWATAHRATCYFDLPAM